MRKPYPIQSRLTASEALKNWHRRQKPLAKKCGAKRKRDGEPCQLTALKNGRCAYHGGRTPKGDAWHKIRYPNGKAPNAEAKLRRKFVITSAPPNAERRAWPR